MLFILIFLIVRAWLASSSTNDFSHLTASKIRSEICRSCSSCRNPKVTSRNIVRRNPGRTTREREKRDSFSVRSRKFRQSAVAPRWQFRQLDVGQRRRRRRLKSRRRWKEVGKNFRNHCDRGNFADFKRVSSGLSNGTRMRITRTVGRPAAFMKADNLQPRSESFTLRRIPRMLYSGATERGWRKEKTERKMRNGEDENCERKREKEKESGKERQLNAISRESNGSRLETRGSD